MIHFQLSILGSFNPTEVVATAHLGTLLGSDLYEFAAQGCGDGNDFAPRCLDVAEGVALLVLLTDEWFQTRFASAFTGELIIDLSGHGSRQGIGLGVLEGGDVGGRTANCELGVLGLLNVG